MRIGLLGFGVVGRGVYDITSGMDDIKVAKVVCLEDVTLPDAEVTRDIQSILTDLFSLNLSISYDFVSQHFSFNNGLVDGSFLLAIFAELSFFLI